jgi:heme exporter protein D
MGTLAIFGIVGGAIVALALLVLIIQKVIAHRREAKSAQIKDRLRRKTKPVPITGPRAATPRTSEE